MKTATKKANPQKNSKAGLKISDPTALRLIEIIRRQSSLFYDIEEIMAETERTRRGVPWFKSICDISKAMAAVEAAAWPVIGAIIASEVTWEIQVKRLLQIDKDAAANATSQEVSNA